MDQMEIVLVSNGVRNVDGYIETQLLAALLHHLMWLAAHNTPLTGCRSVLVHLIDEVKDETFEDLDHVRNEEVGKYNSLLCASVLCIL